MPLRFFRKLFRRKKKPSQEADTVIAHGKGQPVPPVFAGRELRNLQEKARRGELPKQKSELVRALNSGDSKVIDNILTRLERENKVEEVPTLIKVLERLNTERESIFASMFGIEDEKRQARIIKTIRVLGGNQVNYGMLKQIFLVAKTKEFGYFDKKLEAQGKPAEAESFDSKIAALDALGVLIPRAIVDKKIGLEEFKSLKGNLLKIARTYTFNPANIGYENFHRTLAETLSRIGALEFEDEIAKRAVIEVPQEETQYYVKLLARSSYLRGLARLNPKKFFEVIESNAWLKHSSTVKSELAVQVLEEVVEMIYTSNWNIDESFWNKMNELWEIHGKKTSNYDAVLERIKARGKGRKEEEFFISPTAHFNF